MNAERLKLTGVDRLRYFAPTAICIYLAVLCVVLIITSAFIVSLQNAVAITVAGLFGLLLSSGLGLLLAHPEAGFAVPTSCHHIRRSIELRAVRSAVNRAGWRILVEIPGADSRPRRPVRY